MIPSQPAAPGPSPDAVTDAAWNAVAVASVAHREARDALERENVTFARILRTAQRNGMTVPDLCRASGLDEQYLAGFLAAVD